MSNLFWTSGQDPVSSKESAPPADTAWFRDMITEHTAKIRYYTYTHIPFVPTGDGWDERSDGMQYFISFLEGIITFLSPCLLPMLPIYLSYFAGGGVRSPRKTLAGAAGFVLGFTLVFTAMGALAGTIGGWLKAYQTQVNLVSGLIVVLFGLNFLGVFQIKLFHGARGGGAGLQPGFLSSVVFGVIFSLGWTPCVGAFLGSALLLASQQGHVLVGIGMLLAYSLGLGVPFLVSAVLIDQLKTAFDWVKRNYKIINMVSGGLLVILGILMATGALGRLLSLMS